MSDFIITSKTSLRPDPDDSSAEIVSLNPNDKAAKLHELGPWSKISYTDKTGQSFIGWIHTDVLSEITLTAIELFDAPFGQSKTVTGLIIAEKIQLAPWKKVQVRLTDGSVVDGWVTSATAPAGDTHDSGGGTAGPAQDDDLALGPNEIYRPFLLEAQRLTDIDAAAIAALINAEAAKLANGQWNPNSSAAPASSASGLTQFLARTWLAQAVQKNTTLCQVCKDKGFVTSSNQIAPGKEPEILQLRFDPRLSILTAAEYGVANLDRLIKDDLVSEEVGDDEKARFIYLAHHEGLGGAEAFLKGTASYTFSNLVTQTGAKAQSLVDAAHGDTTLAYRNWLNGYIDRHIQPSRFRVSGRPAAAGGGTKSLEQFVGPPIPIAELGGKVDLVKAIQWRLSELGYLDPPADGQLGPVSNWALSEFCDDNGVSLSSGFTKAIAQKLLSPAKLLPDIAATGTWFDKVVAYMQAQKYFICRHPDCKNIVYLEGVDASGVLNDDAPNVFNDLRIVFSIDGRGQPVFESSMWEGTTEPGDFWTTHPMNPKGAARIAFNQYKSWVVGVHHPGSASAHEALVQVAPVTVYRDLNKDFKREGDRVDTGMFAINQHWGYDSPKGDLGRSSAGCLVGRTKAGHRDFMKLVKDDPRYKVNHSYKFVTAIMPGDKVLV